MAEQRSAPIVAAILAGSALIAAALYFGLRARAVEPHAAAEPTPAPREQPADPTALAARAQANAARALDAIRPRLLAECWAPSRAAAADPPRVRYLLDVTFDAGGKQIALGVVEERGLARADVAKCLRRQPLDLRIDPPGSSVRVQLALELP